METNASRDTENFSFLDVLWRLFMEKNKNNKFIIANTTKKTIRYIEKNTVNFPNEYSVLKNKIIESCYYILEYVYRANIFQDIDDKKEIVVKIQILNFYLEEALRKDILTKKKFANYGKHLTELDLMIRSWINNEKDK